MAQKKHNTYQITARMVVLAAIEIRAESYADAAEQAKGLNVTDFVTITDEYQDGSIKIGSIAVANYWNTDQE